MIRLWEKHGRAIHVAKRLLSCTAGAIRNGGSHDIINMILCDFLITLDNRSSVQLALKEFDFPHHHKVETVKIYIKDSKVVIEADPLFTKADQLEILLHRLVAVLFILGLALDRCQKSDLSIMCELGDKGELPAVAFSSHCKDSLLTPDPVYVCSAGYADFRSLVKSRVMAWKDRQPRVIWRGSTTGIQDWRRDAPNEFAWLQRLEMSHILANGPYADICDVGLSGIVQVADQSRVRQIEDSGLLRSRVAKIDYQNFRFAIDVDGNSNAWSGLFECFLAACCVIKIGSPRGFRQWYYSQLAPWRTHIPVSPDMSDLNEIVGWCLEHQAECEQITQAGHALSEALTYDKEIDKAATEFVTIMRDDAGRRSMFASVAAEPSKYCA